ncbi:rna polymerase ii ctd phosphatase [Moniliophthora roreri]|nr:rna polymerase ii ctd phosphatase [Moniliophthora roreri]
MCPPASQGRILSVLNPGLPVNKVICLKTYLKLLFWPRH